jgi:hypothetical protein
VESISRLLACDRSGRLDRLRGSQSHLEDDVRMNNTASLTTWRGRCRRAGGDVCLLSGPVAASKILACLRMAPRTRTWPGSRAAPDGDGKQGCPPAPTATLGCDTPSVRSGKEAAGHAGPACTLSDTERLLKAFPYTPTPP